MVKSIDVAKYIINFFHECEDLITNLKLQKLLYYVQGWHLGLHGEPIFSDDFEAWVHGPVQPEIYRQYQHYRWNPISEDVKNPELDHLLVKHINEVLKEYATETAYSLERMTHLEDPWIIARGSIPHFEASTAQITKESMKNFFARIANEEDKKDIPN